MTIGVFFGGRSPEHDVSIITGQLVISELKKMGKPVLPVYLDKTGRWYIDEQLGALKFFQASDKEERLEEFGKYFLDLEQSKGKMVFRKKGLMGNEVVIDLAFPAFHGSNGEDGTIQGLFELVNIPYVGCDVPASAIAFDKILTKLIYRSKNIATTNFLAFSKADWQNDKEKLLAEIENNLKYPLFIKPPKLGSSIGISKAKDAKELEFAIEVALHYGQTVLVEDGVENLMDVTCCLLGNQEPQPSLLQESLFNSELFDFEEKYLKDGGAQLGNAESSLQIPARLDDETTKKIQTLAREIFKLVGCSGIARVDFLYNKETKEIFANEINPMPGTVYHHLWKASGLELNQLLEKLLQLAQEKHQKKNSFEYAFDSKILSHAQSVKLALKTKKTDSHQE